MPEFETDILGAPYTAETIALPDDFEGPVEATLVRRPADAGAPRGAVLHVHGWADYFFQSEYAEWWTARGYDLYALDLRKYGRSLRDHQSPGYMSDPADYYPEIDEAWRRIRDRDGHTRVLLSGHSTGGLVLSVWACDRGAGVVGMMLNSPFLEMRGPLWLRTIGTRVIDVVGARQPMRVLPRKVTGLYARSLHADYSGEWEFNLDWKPIRSFPVRFGWLRAIRRGQARLHRGLGLPFPVLVLCSARTAAPVVMGEAVHTTDIVLDVEQIRRWAPALGPHVTIAAIEGARHDVVLSLPEPRKRVYDELDRWLGGYVES